MADLIDRKELLNSRPEYLNPQMEDEIASARHQGWNDCNSYYYNLIIKQPTVDTERHAHWNDISINSNAKRIDICSCCKAAINRDIDSDKYNYCPTCGAKMDEVADKDMKGKE